MSERVRRSVRLLVKEELIIGDDLKTKVFPEECSLVTGVPHWSENDIWRLLDAMQKDGHANITQIQQKLPHKTEKQIKSVIKCIVKRARSIGRREKTLLNLEGWLRLAKGKMQTRRHKGSSEVATVVKLLAEDGLVEKHPHPDASSGIDFCAAYNLLYQALWGYPLQPVNTQTANFILENLMEVGKEVIGSHFEKFKEHISETFKMSKLDITSSDITLDVYNKSFEPPTATLEPTIDIDSPLVVKKPVSVYGRKQKWTASTAGTSTALEMNEEPVFNLWEDNGLNPLQLPAKKFKFS